MVVERGDPGVELSSEQGHRERVVALPVDEGLGRLQHGLLVEAGAAGVRSRAHGCLLSAMSVVWERIGFVSGQEPSVSFVDRPESMQGVAPGRGRARCGRVLAQQRRGGGDPTLRLAAPGERGPHWRASRTPDGPVTLAVESRDAAGEVLARAWGPGADWALDQLPDLLGAADDWSGFEPRHPVVAEAWRRHPHLRLGRTGRPLEALVPTIIEQKVTGREAFSGFRALVLEVRRARARSGRDPRAPDPARRRHPGEHAVLGVARPAHRPGPFACRRHRGATRRCARADRQPRQRARPRSSTGRSAACRAWGCGPAPRPGSARSGDPDAVSFGDFHVAKDVGWALIRPRDRRPRALGGSRALASASGPGPAASGRSRAPASEAWSPGVSSWTLAPRVTFSRDICYTEQQALWSTLSSRASQPACWRRKGRDDGSAARRAVGLRQPPRPHEGRHQDDRQPRDPGCGVGPLHRDRHHRPPVLLDGVPAPGLVHDPGLAAPDDPGVDPVRRHHLRADRRGRQPDRRPVVHRRGQRHRRPPAGCATGHLADDRRRRRLRDLLRPRRPDRP